jgi:hypothetical protein
MTAHFSQKRSRLGQTALLFMNFSISTAVSSRLTKLVREIPCPLTADEQKTVDAVLRAYGDLSARELSFLTHGEDPWRDARGDLPDTARSDKIITNVAIAQHYSTLDMARDATDVNDIDWDAWLNADHESVGDGEG